MVGWIKGLWRRISGSHAGGGGTPALLGLDLPWQAGASIDPAREQELMDRLAAMPVIVREVYLLSAVDRMRDEEIGTRLGISRQAVRRYRRDAIERLARTRAD